MAQFRKKPVVIEAVQFHDSKEGLAVVVSFIPNGQVWFSGNNPVIKTLEGDMTAQPGDWIIKGVKGEFYPCKPDIFEATYEAVDESYKWASIG